MLVDDSSEHRQTIRSRHAKFAFNQKSGLFGVARASRGQTVLSLNREAVSYASLALNRKCSSLQIGPLLYDFKYTDYSRTDAFQVEKRMFMRTVMNAPVDGMWIAPSPMLVEMTVEQWTMDRALGSGTYGTVHAATNSKHQLVAIKKEIRSITTSQRVDSEISTLQLLTELVKKNEDDGRLLRLRQVIYEHGDAAYQPPHPESVWLVLEPLVPETLASVITGPDRNKIKGVEAVHIFRELLLGLEFLHKFKYIHGDIKPNNIGLIRADPIRVVLIDLGAATYIVEKRKPTPGAGGTIGYLAPERELFDYDHTVDTWAAGVVGYYFFFGKHPWMLARNPWRSGNEYLRPFFGKLYDNAMQVLSESESKNASGLGDISRLLRKMLQYSTSQATSNIRISMSVALKDACFYNSTVTNESIIKKLRRS